MPAQGAIEAELRTLVCDVYVHVMFVCVVLLAGILVFGTHSHMLGTNLFPFWELATSLGLGFALVMFLVQAAPELAPPVFRRTTTLLKTTAQWALVVMLFWGAWCVISLGREFGEGRSIWDLSLLG